MKLFVLKIWRPVMIVQPTRIPTRRFPQDEIEAEPDVIVETEEFL